MGCDIQQETMMEQPAALDADFFSGVLESNKDAVRAAVRDALLDGVKRQFQWEIPDTVKKTVSEFVTNEVVPEIRAELEANKAEIVEAATVMVRGAAVEIAKAMQEKLAANLSNSWTLRAVVDACFK